jgi:hypothetical protein
MTTTISAWVLTNDAGQFLNPRNGKYDNQISVTSHIYFDHDKANKIAKAYEAKVTEVTITVEVK